MKFVLQGGLLLCACALALAQESGETEQPQENGDSPPVVTTSQGKLQGLTFVSRKGNTYSAFLGVPYAKAPVRFGLAQQPDSWEGVKLAVKKAPHCFQFCLLQQRLIGVEDCLTANIYTPSLSEDAKLPVMVLLHGGGFQFGSGNLFDASYIIDENVILVTIQYRLGALGFLNVGDDTVPANNGMKDQTAALKWVQENIEKFGGDKTRVTIFGFSAGGTAVHYHMLSPMSKGLFSRAISQSGSTLNPWALQKNPKELLQKFADNVQCSTENSKDLVECLREKTPAQIVTAQLKLSKYPKEFDLISMLFSPSVEVGESEPKFLTDTPYKLITTNQVPSKVPWIVGVTANEGGFYIANLVENKKSLETLYTDWFKMAPNMFYYENSATPATQSRVSGKIWEFYLPEGKLTKQNHQELSKIFGDRFFVTGVSRAIREHAKEADFPIYPYIFNYTGSHSIVEGMLYAKNKYGVAHCDDLKYLFNKTYGSPEYDLETQEGQFSANFIKLFTSFAEDGKPSSTWGSAPTWEPFVNDKENEKAIPWYVIDEDTKVLSEDPFKPGTDFWESLPLREFEKEDYPDEKDEL